MTAQTPVPPGYGAATAHGHRVRPGRAASSGRRISVSSPVPHPFLNRRRDAARGELCSRPGAAPCCPGPGTSPRGPARRPARPADGRAGRTRRLRLARLPGCDVAGPRRLHLRRRAAPARNPAVRRHLQQRRSARRRDPGPGHLARTSRRRRPGACPRACSSPSCQPVCCALLCVLARDAFGSRAAGLLAPAVFLTFERFIELASSGPREKTAMVVFLLAALILTGRRRWAAAGVFTALATLTWQPALFVAVAAVVVAVLVGGDSPGARPDPVRARRRRHDRRVRRLVRPRGRAAPGAPGLRHRQPALHLAALGRRQPGLGLADALARLRRVPPAVSVRHRGAARSRRARSPRRTPVGQRLADGGTPGLARGRLPGGQPSGPRS